MKFLFANLFFLTILFTGKAQNCGNVTNFQADIVDLGGGSSSYTFYVTIEATSGGSKSVNLTITCPGGGNFVTNQCEASLATTRVVQFGPYIRTTCSGNPVLEWTGYSNATCGGTSCAGSNMEFSPLPVELVLFETKMMEEGIALKWQTASESNNDKFIIERSGDGREYNPIAEINGMGTSYEMQTYLFVDKQPLLGQNYYRLKQVDFGGAFEYSPVLSVMLKQKNKILVYPTVLTGDLNVALPEDASDDAVLFIYNLQGALVFEQALKGSNRFTVTLPQLVAGQYIAQVVDGHLSTRAMIFKQ